MCYIIGIISGNLFELGLVEFKKCAIFFNTLLSLGTLLGLVEFKKCAILKFYGRCSINWLGLVEFKKCAILMMKK